MPKLQDGFYNSLIESVVRQHLGASWRITGLRAVDATAMHPAVICKGSGGDVFVKEGTNPYSPDQFRKEASGLRHIRTHSEVYTPDIYGVVEQDGTALLIMEAIQTVPVQTRHDWEAVGRGLATLHRATADRCGFFEDNYLGIWPQKNDYRDSWEDFYAEVRLCNMLEMTFATGHLTRQQAKPIEQVIRRLPQLGGPAQPFSLLHGDPWTSNTEPGNLLYDGKQLVLIDGSVYYGNREIDLSTVNIFFPVHDWFFEAYHEVYPIDPGYAERTELWRLNQRISFVGLFGPAQLPQLMEAVDRYL